MSRNRRSFAIRRARHALRVEWANAQRYRRGHYSHTRPVQVPKPQFDSDAFDRFIAGTDKIDADWLAARSPVCPLESHPGKLSSFALHKGEKIIIFDDYQSQGQEVWVHPGLPYDARTLNQFAKGKRRGVWFLCNPVDGELHVNDDGKFSRRSHQNVTSLALPGRSKATESTSPLADWLAAIVQLPLPIVAIYETGGRLPHALLRVDASSKEDWDHVRDCLTPLLTMLGADISSLSAVRLTRLPCCQRLGKEDAHGTYQKFADGPHLQRVALSQPRSGWHPNRPTACLARPIRASQPGSAAVTEDDVKKAKEHFEKHSGAKVPPPRGHARSSNHANDTPPPETEGFAQAGNNGSDQTNQWPEPQPLEDFLFPVVPMCREMLSDPMAVWLCDIAYRMQCPLDFVVSAAMVMTSSVLGTRVRMHPKQFDSWQVDPHLWGGVIAPPGSKKTPATSEVFKLLSRLEITAGESYDDALAAYKVALAEHKAELKAVSLTLEKFRKDRLAGKSKEGSDQREAELKKQRDELLQTEPEHPVLQPLSHQ